MATPGALAHHSVHEFRDCQQGPQQRHHAEGARGPGAAGHLLPRLPGPGLQLPPPAARGRRGRLARHRARPARLWPQRTPRGPAQLYDADQAMQDMLGLLDFSASGAPYSSATTSARSRCATSPCATRTALPRVVIMSCPYDFDLAGRGGAGSRQMAAEVEKLGAFAIPGMRPIGRLCRRCPAALLPHALLPGRRSCGTELGARPREFLQRLMYALSAQGQLLDWSKFPSAGTGYLDVLGPAPPLPWPWLSEAEFEHYVREYTHAGAATTFIGGLNSYRVADRNWELGAPYADTPITQPALFIAGAEDVVLKMIPAHALEKHAAARAAAARCGAGARRRALRAAGTAGGGECRPAEISGCSGAL